jgi:hypothetical protein
MTFRFLIIKVDFMYISRLPASRLLALAISLAAASFASTATAAAGQAAAAADTANKALIPHTAWNCQMADGIPSPDAGKLVFEIDMKIDQAYDVGTTPFGKRDAYVIQGGTVKGEKIDATVMSGGLDFQLTLANGVIEIEQILVWRTSDNRYIYMRQAGVGANARDVRVVMDMEAPNGSASERVNNGKYVARRVLNPTARTLKMSVYDVGGVTIEADKSVKIVKPAAVPPQPWDYRIAAASERQGEVLATENVTLGGGQSVGASKRGSRNILPITGGTLTGGLIPGKVLPGGADYQNLSQAPTIDARYLWQTTEGDIIIVRNAGGGGGGRGGARGAGGPAAPGGPGAPRGGGGGGGLVPYFEVRTDSKYAWLNSGKYLSSPPGMGAGGVSLTFYKSVE